jgi:hypothetical protein
MIPAPGRGRFSTSNLARSRPPEQASAGIALSIRPST